MEILVLTIVALVVVFAVVALLVIFQRKKLDTVFAQAKQESKNIVDNAYREADRIVKESHREAKEEARKNKQSFDDDARHRRSEITKLEQKLKSREETLEKKLSIIEKREKEIQEHQERAQRDEIQYKKLLNDTEQAFSKAQSMLTRVAHMSPEEAKRELMKSLEDQARKQAQEQIRKIEEDTKKEAENRARAVISLAVQRISSEYVNDSMISVVALPNDEMKGRIIGREGRNIRAIEQATGVDLIIDDTPEAVIISCFNPIRRELAKTTLERLIGDGRIHPARIEETVKRVQEEFESTMVTKAEEAAFDAGITDLQPDILKYLGKLRFRAVGQQSVLQHSVEVAHICGIMASEMGLNVKKAKRCGLLHDIGKALDQEIEGNHAQIGADLCAKFQESQDVVDAIRLHHTEDLSQASPYAVVLYVANLLSSNRPGARKEVLETYVKRLSDMENLVKSFAGVDQVFVFQAGKEIRAMVSPTGVSDQNVLDLASDVASKLRHEISFPGQVKVSVMRESKAVDYAK